MVARLDGDWRCDDWGVEAVAFMKVLFPLHRKMMELEDKKRAAVGMASMVDPQLVQEAAERAQRGAHLPLAGAVAPRAHPDRARVIEDHADLP